MIGRRAVIGLSLLSALLLCALAAQSASAALSKNTTAVTCAKDFTKTGDYKDAHCDEKVVTPKTGDFALGNVPEVETKMEGSNEGVTESTKKSEPAVIRGVVPGAETEITCEKIAVPSFIGNTQPGPKEHVVGGIGKIEFSKCKVLKPNPGVCKVNEPIVFQPTIKGVDGLKGPKGEENAMGIEFVGAGAEETFGEVTYGPEAGCTVKNVKAKVQGSMVATSGPTTESAQNNQNSGATEVFTPKFEMQKLKLAEKAAELEMILTLRMAEDGEPITFITIT